MTVFSSRQRGQECKWIVFTMIMLHDLGSTSTRSTLLRPWIKRFTMIISAWRLRTSSKFSRQAVEEIHRNIGSLEIPKQVRIPPNKK